MAGKNKNAYSMPFESDFDEYNRHCHIEPGCTGSFELMENTNVPMPLDGLGTVLLPRAIFVGCPTCKAAYIPEAFQEAVEIQIALKLVSNNAPLSPRHMRFLRLAFNVTQDEIAKVLDVSRGYYCKAEKGRLPLSKNIQILLKLYFASEHLRMKVPMAEAYRTLQIMEQNEPKEPTLTDAEVPLAKRKIREDRLA
jgi:transcriptional regulator with XRE-family HTH domain